MPRKPYEAPKPARLVTPWEIYRQELAARNWQDEQGETTLAFQERMETGRMTDTDCGYVAWLFGTSIDLWRNLNAGAAKWIAEHKEKNDA